MYALFFLSESIDTTWGCLIIKKREKDCLVLTVCMEGIDRRIFEGEKRALRTWLKDLADVQ